MILGTVFGTESLQSKLMIGCTGHAARRAVSSLMCRTITRRTPYARRWMEMSQLQGPNGTMHAPSCSAVTCTARQHATTVCWQSCKLHSHRGGCTANQPWSPCGPDMAWCSWAPSGAHCSSAPGSFATIRKMSGSALQRAPRRALAQPRDPKTRFASASGEFPATEPLVTFTLTREALKILSKSTV